MPAVVYSFDSLASNSMKSKNPNSGCRRVEVAKTLDTTDPNPGKNQGGIAIVESVTIEPVYCLQGNGIDRADTAGCNGKGWTEDTSYTLNTIDRPAVAYLASGKETVGTLMANAGTKLWLGNQEAFSGDWHIVEERRNGGAYSMKSIARNGKVLTEQTNPICASDYKDPDIVVAPPHYIVRRLTPTECARLQGFADRWGGIDEKKDFTDEEYSFWLNVRNTHAAINGKQTKEYTKAQMLTWYNKLHSDSSEYKMWGNGIALPCAVDVLSRLERN